jgi:hypothetical protein
MVQQPGTQSTESRVSRGELRLLKWLTALIPAVVVLIYESAREEAIEHVLPGLPVPFASVVVWVLVLVVTAGFTMFVFRVLDRLQAHALRRGRDIATSTPYSRSAQG